MELGKFIEKSAGDLEGIASSGEVALPTTISKETSLQFDTFGQDHPVVVWSGGSPVINGSFPGVIEDFQVFIQE